MSLFRRSLFALLLLCLGCSAQSTPADVERRVERQVRASYQIPEQVKVQIGSRTSSEFPDYDKIVVILSVGDKHQEQEFLLSKDNKSLVRFSKMDLTRDPYEEVMKKIDLGNRPWRGSRDAKVVLVNYDDFQCPFCTRMHQTLGQIAKEYGDRIKLVYKDYPLFQIHPWAGRAAINAGCLAAQSNDAYWSFADLLHGNGQQISGSQRSLPEQFDALDRLTRDHGQKFKLDATKLNACIQAQDDSALAASVKEAEGLGIQATPTLIINGFKVDGALPIEEVRSLVDRALRDAGQSAPASTAAAK